MVLTLWITHLTAPPKPGKDNDKEFRRKTDASCRHDIIPLGDRTSESSSESSSPKPRPDRSSSLSTRNLKQLDVLLKNNIELSEVQDDPAANEERVKAQELLGEARDGCDR